MAKLSIAIIDDAGMIRDLIKKFVRQNFPEATIYEANNGQTGMTLLRKHRVDLILCDWEMPEMDGEELLRWARQQKGLQNIPFIMVTSRGDKEFVVKAIASGVSDYLVKPFNNKQFLEKIVKAFKRHGVNLPGAAFVQSATIGSGGDSLSVLTGGKKDNKASPQRQKAPLKPLSRGVALVRTSDGEVRCAIKKLDLNNMLGVFKRSDYIPSVLEQVSLDLEFERNEEKKVVRINGFIQMLKTTDDKADCETLLVKVVFVDEDPQKRLLISEYVGQFN